MPAQRKIPTHYQESKRCLRVWSTLAIFHAWSWSLDSGRPRWMSCQMVHCIYHWQPRLLWVLPHAMFQRLMQNCLGELNLSYCLIYLDNIVIFSQTTEEHLHCLCIIFDWFREYNLKLKPSKCDFFWIKITCLAHWVLKDGVCPSNLNLEAITECTLPWTYTEVHAFLSLVGHYRRFIKGFAQITQPLSVYLTGEGASRKLEWVSLTKGAMKAFKALKQACMTAPILSYADYTKLFLLETDVSKEALGAVLLQKQVDGQYHPITYGSRALMSHEKNYHSTKLEFLALKWEVTEHFNSTCSTSHLWCGQIIIHSCT